MIKPTRAMTVVHEIEGLEIRKRRPLVIVETGTIRSLDPQYIRGDGYSTLFIAEYLSSSPYPHVFYSIDLDVSVARQYLQTVGLSRYVRFIQGDSREVLAGLGVQVDLAYLDSGNDAGLILSEFQVLEPALSRPAVIVVDDVELNHHELHKGDLVVPYARHRGYHVTLPPRQAIIRAR